jgi:hypothetical protein
LQIHGRVLPLAAALVVIFGFLLLDLSGTADVNARTLWWDLFQVGSVLFVLFMLLSWTLRIDRRQPSRKFVA